MESSFFFFFDFFFRCGPFRKAGPSFCSSVCSPVFDFILDSPASKTQPRDD